MTMPAGDGSRILLTDLSLDGTQVLAIPQVTAVAELRTYGCLLHARTLGEARADPAAAHLVEQQLPRYLAQLWQETDVEDEQHEKWKAQHRRNDAPFDADEFWGEDDFMDWHPEPRHATGAWLATEPGLFERYARPDEGWGFDYSPVPVIAPTDREAFEGGAEALGYEVRRLPGLEELYLRGPGPDAVHHAAHRPAWLR